VHACDTSWEAVHLQGGVYIGQLIDFSVLRLVPPCSEAAASAIPAVVTTSERDHNATPPAGRHQAGVPDSSLPASLLAPSSPISLSSDIALESEVQLDPVASNVTGPPRLCLDSRLKLCKFTRSNKISITYFKLQVLTLQEPAHPSMTST
jgi:hypothetical protein